MKTAEKFPFQTSFAFFTIERGKNGVDVKYNDQLVATLTNVNVWDKDTINKRISQQRESIMSIMSCIADSESVEILTKRNKELALENKELKQRVENPVVNVCSANVEAIFKQCLDLMAETYNEKGFTMSRGNSILNKYKENKR